MSAVGRPAPLRALQVLAANARIHRQQSGTACGALLAQNFQARLAFVKRRTLRAAFVQVLQFHVADTE